MDTPKVAVSWGELLDKLTILQIKLENISIKSALDNIEREYTQLQVIFSKNISEDSGANKLLMELKEVNQKLWDIEDKIRDKERKKIFDNEFIQLARSVYITNDERSRIKRRINDMLGSELVEEKSYADY
jgi:hypothetical protein